MLVIYSKLRVVASGQRKGRSVVVAEGKKVPTLGKKMELLQVLPMKRGKLELLITTRGEEDGVVVDDEERGKIDVVGGVVRSFSSLSLFFIPYSLLSLLIFFILSSVSNLFRLLLHCPACLCLVYFPPSLLQFSCRYL